MKVINSLRRSISGATTKLKDSSPTILSLVATGGVVGTGVLAAKGGMQTEKDISEHEEKLSKKESVMLAVPHFLPAFGAGVGTIICILGANTLNKRQQAAITSAYALLRSSYDEYRLKVKEILGEEASKRIDSVVIKDSADRPPFDESTEKPLFYDTYGQRYFNRSWVEMLDAEKHANRQLILANYISLNEYFVLLGLDEIPDGDDRGWSLSGYDTYGYQWIDFEYDRVEMDDGLECYVIRYPFEPHDDYMEW